MHQGIATNTATIINREMGWSLLLAVGGSSLIAVEQGYCGPCRMKYSPTYKVVWMVGPRNGQKTAFGLSLRDLAL